MKLAIILGTRPEIIKMSPIIRVLERKRLDFFILHTGQHYTEELNTKIWEDLVLPKPRYNLGVGPHPFREQVGVMTKEIMGIFKKEKPDVVLVQGDTVSTLAGALAAKRLNILLGHHEAGLRSHDTTMLEEMHRVVADHISDYLFVSTKRALQNLIEEGKNPKKIHLTGNTIVDAVLEHVRIAEMRSDSLKTYNLQKKTYALLTLHRAENVDTQNILRSILDGMSRVQKELNISILFPMHPRTRKKIKEFHLEIPNNIQVVDPVGFLDFLMLEKNARIVFTDSGGVQEECFILKVPCVTLRDNTERPETVALGVNVLVGRDQKRILEGAHTMLTKTIAWDVLENPFGDGHAGERIVLHLQRRFMEQKKRLYTYRIKSIFARVKRVLRIH